MVIKGKRAIAYFDILGFKAKIENIPLDQLSQQYEQIIRQTDGEYSIQDGNIVNKQVCYRYIFSDSIFLVAQGDNEKSFTDLFSYAWRMMQMFIAAGFPLRGAITYGDIYVNFEKNIFLGKAISEAAILEGEQDWIGAVVDDAVIDRYKSIFDEDSAQGFIANTLIPIYNVPLKNGKRRKYPVINWRHNIISQDGIQALFKNEPYNESVQTKINNTLCFSKEIVDSQMAYSKDELIPERYRKFYVGRGAPKGSGIPFTHGDEY